MPVIVRPSIAAVGTALVRFEANAPALKVPAVAYAEKIANGDSGSLSAGWWRITLATPSEVSSLALLCQIPAPTAAAYTTVELTVRPIPASTAASFVLRHDTII